MALNLVNGNLVYKQVLSMIHQVLGSVHHTTLF